MMCMNIVDIIWPLIKMKAIDYHCLRALMKKSNKRHIWILSDEIVFYYHSYVWPANSNSILSQASSSSSSSWILTSVNSPCLSSVTPSKCTSVASLSGLRLFFLQWVDSQNYGVGEIFQFGIIANCWKSKNRMAPNKWTRLTLEYICSQQKKVGLAFFAHSIVVCSRCKGQSRDKVQSKPKRQQQLQQKKKALWMEEKPKKKRLLETGAFWGSKATEIQLRITLTTCVVSEE